VIENLLYSAGIISGACAMFTLLVIAMAWAWMVSLEAWERRYWNVQRQRLQDEMHQLDRWLCYEAPVVAAVVSRLRKVADGETVPHVEDFREEIRAGKYAKYSEELDNSFH
jgi:hypothetical protein